MLLAQHSTNTLHPTAYETPAAQLASNPQGYNNADISSSVDDLIDLTNWFYSNADTSNNTQEVAELATSLKNSLPSSPPQPESPTMQRPEQLPGISSLSGELSASLQAQLLAPLSSVKKQYPFYPSPSQRAPAPQASSTASSVVLPSLPSLSSLPSLASRPTPQQPQRQTRVPVPSPESSPCSSPPPSPKRNKKNYTKEFNLKFHELLNNNEQASNEWHLYAQRHKGKCTIKRAPCIKVSRGFCASYGQEFAYLAKEEKYGALGTRTECACMHKPAPLASSGPARKQRQSARAAPYPASSSQSAPGTPDLELPTTPADAPSPLVCSSTFSFLIHAFSITCHILIANVPFADEASMDLLPPPIGSHASRGLQYVHGRHAMRCVPLAPRVREPRRSHCVSHARTHSLHTRPLLRPHASPPVISVPLCIPANNPACLAIHAQTCAKPSLLYSHIVSNFCILNFVVELLIYVFVDAFRKRSATK